MLLMSHTAMGIFIASSVNDPIIGGSLSFLSHYILDIIPHEPKDELFYVPPKKSDWSEEIKNKLQNRKKTSFADLFFSIALITVYIIIGKFSVAEEFMVIALVLFFSVLPDIFTIIYLRFPYRFLSSHYDLHYKIHKIIPIHMSYFYATAYQIIFSVMLIYLALVNR